MNRLICDDTPGTAETADPEGFEAACAAALKLAKELGDGWLGRVWENLGWHYEALSPCRRINVYPSGDDYGAMLHEPDDSGMSTYLGAPGHGNTPKAAVVDVLKNVKARIKEIQTLIEGL